MGSAAPLGQRDSERLPVSGNDKTVSGNGKTRDGTVGDPFLRDPSSECLAPSEFFHDSLHEKKPIRLGGES
jgi:hypothetical protein